MMNSMYRVEPPMTMDNTITNDTGMTTINSPLGADNRGQAMQNINVNINFNVTGNINIVNPQSDSHADDVGALVKSSLRRSVSGANKFVRQRRNQHGSVDFDVRFIKDQIIDGVEEAPCSDIQQEEEDDEEGVPETKRKSRSQRPMSAAVNSTNKMFRAKLLSPKDADSSNMASLS